MPTYEYQCEKCGHRFEAFQSMKDKPLTSCPACSGPVKRLISPGAGLIFKGSGFYITDYKKTGSSPTESGKSKEIQTDKPVPKSTEKKDNKTKDKPSS